MNIRQFELNKASLLTFAFLLFTFYFPAFGQDEIPANAAKPPEKVLIKAEKEKLEAEKDVKKRLILAISMMETHMKNAEARYTEEDYSAMFDEFGVFHALMDETLSFLDRNNIGKGKILDYYKRFEISLRGFIARIEVIRRELPPRYEYYVKTLVKAVRDARTRAVAPLYDNSVVPNQFTK